LKEILKRSNRQHSKAGFRQMLNGRCRDNCARGEAGKPVSWFESWP